jgi:diguanylate cyclase (GGDEF)-like protein/PAS domain S-box-containing protein
MLIHRALPQPRQGALTQASSIWEPCWRDDHVYDAVLSAVTGDAAQEGDAPAHEWVVGRRLTELMPKAAGDGRLALLCRTAETKEPFRVIRPDRPSGRATELTGQWLSDGQVLLQLRDVASAERRARRQALVEHRWDRIIQDAPLGVTVTNFQGILLEVNRTLCTLLGRREDELVGHAFNEFTHPDDPTRLDRAEALRTGRATMDKRYLTSTGETISLRISASLVIENGEQLLLSICEDITAEVAAKAALQRQATVDEVTGLWNRSATRDLLHHYLDEVCAGVTDSVSLLFFDLDKFKVVNNSLGHGAGDLVLAEVASRLRQALPPDAVVGRDGGDEFVVILIDAEDPRAIALRTSAALGSSVRVGHRDVAVGASVGIAIARPGDVAGRYPETALLRDADTALQVAKRAGGGAIVVFDEALRQEAVARLDDEEDLRLGLVREELVLHFQPITRVESAGEREYEALVRWNHPRRGLLGPGEFLPVAEETGLIVELSQQVLELACRQLASWRRDDPTVRVAVNVSAQHLGAGRVTDDVFEALRRHGLPASALTVEVTEQTLIDSSAKAAVALSELRAAGARIAIDDFGTGYSSLAYLRELPVDILKIDRAFVAGLGTPANDGKLFCAVVSLASSLGLETVAEGIETDAELDVVRRSGVTYAQGFLLGRPNPA